MKYFDFTAQSPAENLACDEAILDLCEVGHEEEILRFWEPTAPFVVVGYANRAATEVRIDHCCAAGIPVLRRCTGGGTVLQGPGCLNYSLIMQIAKPYPFPGSNLTAADGSMAHPLQSIAGANSLILERHRAALQPLLKSPIQLLGHTDLAIGHLKFSGNAQRRLKHCLIFHGTFLLDFNIASIERILPMPSKQPAYRRDRAHTDFLTNLNLAAVDVKSALRKIWHAETPLAAIPSDAIATLAAKYSTDDWNLKF